jgi:hypothetical protein
MQKAKNKEKVLKQEKIHHLQENLTKISADFSLEAVENRR